MDEDKSFRDRIEEIRERRRNSPVASSEGPGEGSNEKTFREQVKEVEGESHSMQPDFPELMTEIEMELKTLSANRILIETDEERLTFLDEEVTWLDYQGIHTYLISGEPNERTSLSEPTVGENTTSSSTDTKVFDGTSETESWQATGGDSEPATHIQYCPRCGGHLGTISTPAYCPHCGHGL